MKNKNKIAPAIINFCKEISTEQPIFVPLRPVVDKPVNECFSIVPKHIATHGGKQKIGWCIHVWRNVLIEAEFHCVWESPEGELIDVTPKDYFIESIIFLHDPQKEYTGIQVDNIRKPFINNKEVLELISLKQEYFRYINETYPPNYYGKVIIKGDFLNKYNRMNELNFSIIKKFGLNMGYPTGSGFMNYHIKKNLS